MPPAWALFADVRQLSQLFATFFNSLFFAQKVRLGKGLGEGMSCKLEPAKETQIRVLFCSPTAALPAVVAPFLEQIKAQAAFNVQTVSAIHELTQELPTGHTGCIAILCIQDRVEFVQVLQFLTAHEVRLQQGLLRVLVFSRLDHPRVASILKSKGVFDIPDCSINTKAFSYKIKTVLQVLEQAIEAAKRQPAAEAATLANRASRASIALRGSASLQVLWEKPIEHFSDFWILVHEKHARYVIGKWMVNFYGPGPNAGTWESTDLELHGEKGWIFQPHVPTDQTFYKDEGRWVFFGNCPEFSWEQRLWYFISKHPSFYFYIGNEIIHQKITYLDSGDIQILANSETGKNLKPQITSTIEASIRLKTDRENSKGGVVIETDPDRARELSVETEAAEIPKELEATQDAYKSAELQIRITTKNGQKHESDDPIRLIELRETQAIIDIPVGLLVVGDQIEIEAGILEGQRIKKLTFSASTRIVETDMNDGEGPDRRRAAAICELNHSIKTHFTDIVNQLQAKREVLDLFFKKAKGTG